MEECRCLLQSAEQKARQLMFNSQAHWVSEGEGSNRQRIRGYEVPTCKVPDWSAMLQSLGNSRRSGGLQPIGVAVALLECSYRISFQTVMVFKVLTYWRSKWLLGITLSRQWIPFDKRQARTSCVKDRPRHLGLGKKAKSQPCFYMTGAWFHLLIDFQLPLHIFTKCKYI